MRPLEATRSAPFSATIRDCLVETWPSPGDSPTWTISVGGHEHPGPPVDTARHTSSDVVKDLLKQWAKEHADLFD